MGNAYLDIAEKAIREAGHPLHPKEMLAVAQRMGFIPPHLHGKTQYKTMAARLSTEIRAQATRSPFFRTSANRFFLRELKTEEHEEYRAPKREKKLHNEPVLTIRGDFLERKGEFGIVRNIGGLIELASKQGQIEYVVRKSAEQRFDVKQVIAYALIYRSGHLLTYRRGAFNSAADELRMKRSIGFGGHVSYDDLSLFDQSSYGILENARRELAEELVFDNYEIENLHRADSFQLLCGINTSETIEAQKHIAVSVVYFCSNDFTPEKNEMSINDLRWISVDRRENDLDAYEPWSRTILQAIFSGELKIERP